MKHVYLGRQPIIGLDGTLNSYEILYREGHEKKQGVSNLFVSASVISNVLNKFGTNVILGERKAFAKVDQKFLMNDLIFTIPSQFFIFSIVDSEVDERVIERCEQLKERGYELALNDITFNKENLQKYLKIVHTLSYVKINFDKKFKNDSNIKEIINDLLEKNIKIVATKIETDEDYLLAKELGCELFQGYFFSKPKIFEDTKYEPSQINIVKLYTMLMQDASIDDITTEFEQNHELTVQLLHFINSGAFFFRNKISSIHHVLTLVGRMPLAQWLMLMIYSKSVAKKGEVSPLMLMVKNRTELMEYIVKQLKPNIQSNSLGQAYFVGVLSLIDAVFHEKLEKILDSMNIDDLVRDALLEGKGTLGDILTLIKDMETFNTSGIEIFIIRYKIKKEIIEKISLQSMKSVEKFEKAVSTI